MNKILFLYFGLYFIKAPTICPRNVYVSLCVNYDHVSLNDVYIVLVN